MPLINLVILLALVLLYIAIVVVHLYKNKTQVDFSNLVDIKSDEKHVHTLFYEEMILKHFGVKAKNAIPILYTERALLVVAFVALFYMLRGLAIAIVGALLVGLLTRDAYEKVVYNSGVRNVGKVVNFINFFVPHINSGNSADQSFLGYLEYSKDEELQDYYENHEHDGYQIPVDIRQIVEIYNIAKYNEQKGISNYTYILNEISEDMSQKQVYYNSFQAKMGEINPIMWSYYFGVPILTSISVLQAPSFWQGVGGYAVSLVLLGMFSAFKFLVFKLQKDTIKKIF
jgi:hypothetical protein